MPSFTLVKPKDSLLIVNHEEFLSIYDEEFYDSIIKEIEKEYITYDLAKKRECDLKLLNLYKSILKKVECDNQKRINLGGIKTDKKEFLCIGARNHLILDTKKIK